MSSTDSMEVSPAPPSLFEENNDIQWLQESAATVTLPDNATLQEIQWSELPPPELVPVTVNEPSPVYTAGPPVYNQQKFNFPSGIDPVNTYNPPTYMDISFVSQPTTSFLNPNGTAVVNGLPNGTSPRPMLPNGTFVNNPNSWMPNLNPNRLMTRSGWSQNEVKGAKSANIVRKPKRVRTAFSTQQIMELEQEYVRTRYLDRDRRIKLAEILKLNERTIKIWFQNRRMKEKKDKAEMLEASSSSTTDSSADLTTMPIIHQEQLDKAFNGNVYMEYPVVSPPNLVAGPTMSMGQPTQGITMGSYAYVPEGYNYRQMHLQMQYPTLFEEANENQWHQESAATLPDNVTLQQIQWSELPPPELVPVTVSEPSPVYTAGPTVSL
ncbi:pancreas/duodenum homeobox protein 1-like [Pectinophora gossypiella]|uniref:pancreas/duodenum homeobox protein 1-like n=1 Tax=Pectinophora gossypiella TaxID=13191 RepID=UPI00214F5430|nr:pancreas/duodenum homeobox protein 1-like [Pectinophora gossypiella]